MHIVYSYSPGGASLHVHLVHGSLGPPESAPHKWQLDQFSVFTGLTDVPNTHTETTKRDDCSTRPRLSDVCDAA